jgi:hypothetical protein
LTIEKDDYERKNTELQRELDSVKVELDNEFEVNADFVELSEKMFDLTQNAAETWLGSNCTVRRELLEILSLNRELSDSSLLITWIKPFDALAEQPQTEDNRGDWRCTFPNNLDSRTLMLAALATSMNFDRDEFFLLAAI